jgi:hypothetical protein
MAVKTTRSGAVLLKVAEFYGDYGYDSSGSWGL